MRTNARKVVAGIFWMLDNGAKWKDLPGPVRLEEGRCRDYVEVGYRRCLRENLRAAGPCGRRAQRLSPLRMLHRRELLEGQGRRRRHWPHESREGRENHGVGRCSWTPRSDRHGLANHSENHLVQQLFDFMLPKAMPREWSATRHTTVMRSTPIWRLEASSSSHRTAQTGSRRSSCSSGSSAFRFSASDAYSRSPVTSPIANVRSRRSRKANGARKSSSTRCRSVSR